MKIQKSIFTSVCVILLTGLGFTSTGWALSGTEVSEIVIKNEGTLGATKDGPKPDILEVKMNSDLADSGMTTVSPSKTKRIKIKASKEQKDRTFQVSLGNLKCDYTLGKETKTSGMAGCPSGLIEGSKLTIIFPKETVEMAK